jgi:hypothetical protein
MHYIIRIEGSYLRSFDPFLTWTVYRDGAYKFKSASDANDAIEKYSLTGAEIVPKKLQFSDFEPLLTTVFFDNKWWYCHQDSELDINEWVKTRSCETLYDAHRQLLYFRVPCFDDTIPFFEPTDFIRDEKMVRNAVWKLKIKGTDTPIDATDDREEADNWAEMIKAGLNADLEVNYYN